MPKLYYINLVVQIWYTLQMKFIEKIRNVVDEYLPFNPDIPVSIILPIIVDILESEIGEDLLAVKHLGSTAETQANLARTLYRPPHRGSDVDLLGIISDDADVDVASGRISVYLTDHPFTTVGLDIHFTSLSAYEAASLDGHPALLFYAHAKEYGYDVGSRTID